VIAKGGLNLLFQIVEHGILSIARQGRSSSPLYDCHALA
jgi:hypothetical protein